MRVPGSGDCSTAHDPSGNVKRRLSSWKRRRNACSISDGSVIASAPACSSGSLTATGRPEASVKPSETVWPSGAIVHVVRARLSISVMVAVSSFTSLTGLPLSRHP